MVIFCKDYMAKTIVTIIIFTFFCFPSVLIHAQELRDTSARKNSIIYLDDVPVIGYIQPQIRWETPVSVALIDKKEIDLQSMSSMIPVVNTVPGVRMEERSPGSYRLSIRGSLTRSPYGVRNVKIYYNDFALTDAGGNTYLNALNVHDLAGIEIWKGPDGSLFGANSGGVVFLKSNADTLSALTFQVYGGSMGLAGNSVYSSQNTGKHFWTVRESFQRSDGYRENTGNRRLFLQLSDVWRYRKAASLEVYAFYSDLAYNTPGGLTWEQFQQDPRQSRPPTATLPGSREQRTGVSSKMYFGGIRHKIKIRPWLEHTVSIWGTHVDFINSFITNYETRKENNAGVRTFISLFGHHPRLSSWKPSLDIGVEAQRMVSDIHNYDNHAGKKGEIQAYNNIVNYQCFTFVRARVEWRKRLVIQASVSLNWNGYHFRDTTRIKNSFLPVWMPHLAVNYRIGESVALRLTFSKGYSTPTTAEIRPVDNKIYTDLQPEQGWNTEAGVRLKFMGGRIFSDASCFHYLLQDGIVSQMDSLGNTFFVNSGKIRQIGVEYSGSWIILPYSLKRVFFKKIQWTTGYTYSHFRYDRYIINNVDYSGSRVAGVPAHVWTNGIRFDLPLYVYLYVHYNFTGRIPLNDANTSYAEAYHLVSVKFGFDRPVKSKWPCSVYLAIDNLFNRKYSLGNDINAFGGRYYNTAPGINFQLGVKWDI